MFIPGKVVGFQQVEKLMNATKLPGIFIQGDETNLG